MGSSIFVYYIAAVLWCPGIKSGPKMDACSTLKQIELTFMWQSIIVENWVRNALCKFP